jgi:hypothetical protein
MLTLPEETAGQDGRIRVGDVIAAVNGWRCQGHRLDAVSRHFSGPEGESAPWMPVHVKCLLFSTLACPTDLRMCAQMHVCKMTCISLSIEVGVLNVYSPSRTTALS